MGNLFYRGVNISELKKMPYYEMKYWNKWHLLFNETERKEFEKAKNGK